MPTREELIAQAKALDSGSAPDRASLIAQAQALDNGTAIDKEGPIVRTLKEHPDAVSVGAGVLGGGAKALDVLRGSLTGPALAALLGGVTGKNVYKGSEHLDAMNPTNLNMYPSSSELMDRAGVPAGAKLSDIAPGYGEPGNSPWYQPEKGGLLDPTVRGAGGLATDIAIDPLTYLSMGASAAGKQAAQKGAVELATGSTKGLLDRGAGIAQKMGLTDLTKKLAETKAGQIAVKAATAPTDIIKDLGTRLYRSTILPVEFEGAKYGKKDVADTMYRSGISSPLNLRESVSEANSKLIAARDRILTEAGSKGATLDMKNAMQEATDKIAEIRAEGRPNQQAIADQLQKQVDMHMKMVAETPAIPARKEIQEVGKSQYGTPIKKEVVIPEVPAVPGKKVLPETGSGLKTDIYNMVGDDTWNQMKKSGADAQVTGPLGRGLKAETENSVGRGMGDQAQKQFTELNDSAGKLLSTKKSQQTAQNQAQRLLSNATNLTGTDTVLAGMGAATGHNEGGLTAIAIKKLLDGARLAAMPMGYGMKKAASSPIMGPLMDSYIREKIKQAAGQGSLEKRLSNGEE